MPPISHSDPLFERIFEMMEPIQKATEDFQKKSKDNYEALARPYGEVNKGLQLIGTRMTDYSKKAFEDGTAALEKMFGVKSFDKAIEVQTEYAKTAYEGFMAEASKIGEMYAGLAKETYKPFESLMGKAK